MERDDEKFHAYGQQLLTGVSSSIRGWLNTTISNRLGEATFDHDLQRELEQVSCDVEQSITTLVNADVDEPLSGPLERIRRAVEPLNDALENRGAPQPARDPVEAAMRPADQYALGPMTFRDLGDDVHEAGIAWGAAKAHLHLQRRRRPDTS